MDGGDVIGKPLTNQQKISCIPTVKNFIPKCSTVTKKYTSGITLTSKNVELMVV